MTHLLGFIAIGIASGCSAGRLRKDEAYGLLADLVIGTAGFLFGTVFIWLLIPASFEAVSPFVTAPAVGAACTCWAFFAARSPRPESEPREDTVSGRVGRPGSVAGGVGRDGA